MFESNIDLLNSAQVEERLRAIESLRKLVNESKLSYEKSKGYVNNHIHTTYSFSPYSPTRAVWEAKQAGLLTAGIVDHDSVSGINEFIAAGKIIDIETTVGLECRVSMAQTPFAKRRLNSPDQIGIAYVTLQGIPHHQVETLETFLAPYRAKRNERNKKMIENINNLFNEKILDFEKDVAPLSMYHDGGSITERHLLFALAKKLILKYGKGELLINALTNDWSLNIKGKMYEWLMEVNNPYYDYDLLSILKGAIRCKI